MRLLLYIDNVLCAFQPGCVNTTEVDIKKSSRMKNPHKTRKVPYLIRHHENTLNVQEIQHLITSTHLLISFNMWITKASLHSSYHWIITVDKSVNYWTRITPPIRETQKIYQSRTVNVSSVITWPGLHLCKYGCKLFWWFSAVCLRPSKWHSQPQPDTHTGPWGQAANRGRASGTGDVWWKMKTYRLKTVGSDLFLLSDCDVILMQNLTYTVKQLGFNESCFWTFEFWILLQNINVHTTMKNQYQQPTFILFVLYFYAYFCVLWMLIWFPLV